MEQQQASSNVYMQQVMRQQADVEQKLAAPAKRRVMAELALPGDAGGGGGGSETPAVDVRITGWWRWKRVIVPPNAYVVHTRLGRPDPVTSGMGISFSFNPYTDAFLVVPAAMQTIMISANCICKERQGILVQGYVQWIVDDFMTAYRKLDFSDPVEPMKVVNVQLREQAEAAIKDTVVSMGIDEVLADKQPIVEVLTARLRQLAEGSQGKEGLGLRIITVQIKEAVVSSTRLWETLQAPFRAERKKTARLAELEHEGVVHERETQARRERERLEIQTQEDLSARKAEAAAKGFDIEQQEAIRRAAIEAEALATQTTQRQAKLEADAALETLSLQKALEREAQRLAAKSRQVEEEIRLEAARRKVENDASPALVQQRLIAQLPAIAAAMPKPAELKTISLSGLDAVGPLLTDLGKLVASVKTPA